VGTLPIAYILKSWIWNPYDFVVRRTKSVSNKEPHTSLVRGHPSKTSDQKLSTSSVLKTPSLSRSQTSGSYCAKTSETHSILRFGRSRAVQSGCVWTRWCQTQSILRFEPKYFTFLDVLSMPEPPTPVVIHIAWLPHPPIRPDAFDGWPLSTNNDRGMFHGLA